MSETAPPGAPGATGLPVEMLGLRPRPEVPPAVMAAISAAVDQAWPRPVLAAPVEDTSHLAWRFSGRWWHRPLPTRRARPYPAR